MQYWLIKSEPSVFSIGDLEKKPKQTTAWDGVRNYQVRNWLRDTIKKGDLAFFYHSSCEIPGIAGVMEVIKAGYPDPTQFDPEDHHYDPSSDPDNPRWYCVDVKFKSKFKRVITIDELRSHKPLAKMQVLQRGNRLSITPVTKSEWIFILHHSD
ncbi:MAG TPA: EVE domain-containing protein [Gammaproteobacteria bacterium]|nr:EVE domain-containing protein [Gammaproteobacteria bacterium]